MIDTRTPASMRLRRRIGLAGLATAVAALVAVTAPGFSAESATAAGTPGPGWVRLAHLSPDTKAVDVRVMPLGGTTPVVQLKNVAYGSVSSYAMLDDGVYTVNMVKAGAKPTATPVLTASLDVTKGIAKTVAAFGSNKKLKVQAFTDDLTTPAAGTARIRLIQASTRVKSVDVETTTGLAIANDAAAGSATGYAAVPAGTWTLKLTGAKVSSSAKVTLTAGSVSTLLVLDTPKGLTVRPVLDSAAVAQAPVGGVNTGGGYLATHRTGDLLTGLDAG